MRKRFSGILFILCGAICVMIISILWCCYIQKEECFADNAEGNVLPLAYSDSFSRINCDAKAVAAITAYKDGFIGAFYGNLFYYNEKDNSISQIEPPEGFFP